ncbi:MAG: glycosyltransferase family 2 protein [Chlamydiales bacterium]|nr:glycosyltransferase family 2 protein [Chlamydiales bacterium]
MSTPKYSVVIPMKNEEDNIGQLIKEIEPVMGGLGKPWELICIDDGSTDKTLPILESLTKEKDFLRVIVFDRNYGQSSAFDVGFREARGDFIITLDGDLQNDPNDIPKLLVLAERYDLVCGVRQKRRDTIIKRVTSFLANKVRSRFCGDGVSDTGCSLKVYRRSCFDKIKMFHGMHRFLPALFIIEGFEVHEIPVNHRERMHGTTKYNFFNRSFNTIADMFAVRWMRKRRLNYQIKQELP